MTATELTLTYDEAEAWLRARMRRLHVGLCATERALEDERQLTAYLAAENAILRAERGSYRFRARPHHVQPHER